MQDCRSEFLFRQSRSYGDQREFRAAGCLEDVKIVVAVTRIKGFCRQRDQEIALSGMANAFAFGRMTDALGFACLPARSNPGYYLRNRKKNRTRLPARCPIPSIVRVARNPPEASHIGTSRSFGLYFKGLRILDCQNVDRGRNGRRTGAIHPRRPRPRRCLLKPPHDGWKIYYKFLKAAHQSCAAHLIRRCRDLAAVATPTAAVFPLAVKQILEDGLALRDRYLEQKISLHGLWTAAGRLEAKLDRWLGRHYRDPANRRLAKHLRHERPYLFTFLYCPGLVDATNNLAERVMRLLVVLRKNWGGNRTENGARAQAVLTSILCTARQQDKDAFALLTDLLRSPHPKLLDLVPPATVDSASISAASGRAEKAPPAGRDARIEMRLPALAQIPVLQDGLAAGTTARIFSSA